MKHLKKQNIHNSQYISSKTTFFMYFFEKYEFIKIRNPASEKEIRKKFLITETIFAYVSQ